MLSLRRKCHMSGTFCSQESKAVDQLGFGPGWLPVSVTFLTVVTKCLTETTEGRIYLGSQVKEIQSMMVVGWGGVGGA